MKNKRRLEGKKVAILAAEGFEYTELTKPKEALREAGAEVVVISPSEFVIRGWRKGDWADEVLVDLPLDKAFAQEFDALVLPGGVKSPDELRMNAKAVEFTKAIFSDGKPVGAICHGPWLLVETKLLQGRRLTSWPGIRTDLENAGADWEDKEVVVDTGLVTSRKPADLDAFCTKLIEEIAKGRQPQRPFSKVDEAGRESFPASDPPAY